MYYKKRRGRHGFTPKPEAQPSFIPPSVGGVNALDSVANMAPNECIYTYNLMPSEYGLRLRAGYREWANGLPSQSNTLIAYEGLAGDGNEDRLWAVCAEGIYNITLLNTTAPVQDVAFTVNVTGEAGYGVWTQFINTSDDHYLFYADAENGLHLYTESTQTWSVPAITGVDPTKIAYVLSWKNRLWMIEQDSGVAWYLPVDAIAGAAQQFTFGADLRYGGELKALYNWTIDGGDGLDDYLVGVGRGGDVLVYRGSDPSSPEFSRVGSWNIGDIPGGRRGGVAHGGDLYLLSVFGITSLRDLLQGSEVSSENVKGPSAKINRFLRSDILADKEDFSWSLSSNPSDGAIVVVTPYSVQAEAIQYVKNMLTGAWGMWRGVPAHCVSKWDGSFYFADTEGRVWLYDGFLDGSLLDGTEGKDIDYQTLTSFQNLGGPHGVNKMVGVVRTQGVLSGSTNITTSVVYDYDVGASMPFPSVSPAYGDSLWDASVWGVATWAGGLRKGEYTAGVSGHGFSVAVGIRGTATSRINLVGWDLTFKTGGLM